MTRCRRVKTVSYIVKDANGRIIIGVGDKLKIWKNIPIETVR